MMFNEAIVSSIGGEICFFSRTSRNIYLQCIEIVQFLFLPPLPRHTNFSQMLTSLQQSLDNVRLRSGKVVEILGKKFEAMSGGRIAHTILVYDLPKQDFLCILTIWNRMESSVLM